MVQQTTGKAGLHLVDDKQDCERCDSQDCCLRSSLDDDQMEALTSIVRLRGPYKPGDAIFKIEDPFKSLFSIQSGAVKIESISQGGNRDVSGFYFAGELTGIESIGDARYNNDAIALETTWVCELPFHQLELLCGAIPALQRQILILLGEKIRRTNSIVVQGRHMKAEKRVMYFLHNLCRREALRHNNRSKKVHLPMTKGDIASYLGLRPESLSRALSKLQREGSIRNSAKQIELLDQAAAYEFACD
ncbi:MAG: helix-turn-helix domain-containing protein [Deltaproteobacteria bacterium]|nr:helix-turn-helix domain-containing protein [Deltaproteobacteria bacterium]